MDFHAKTYRSTADANGKPQISCGPHLHRVLSEKILPFRGVQYGVVIGDPKLPGRKRQLFRVFQNFVDPAASFDRAGYCQVAVHFQQKFSREFRGPIFTQCFLHCRNLLQRRFDDAIRCFCFRETGFYKWCKAAKARFSILNVFIGYHQLTQPVDHVEWQAFIVEPKDFFLSADRIEDRIFFNQLFCIIFHGNESFPIRSKVYIYQAYRKMFFLKHGADQQLYFYFRA